jgi:hypothetical protein
VSPGTFIVVSRGMQMNIIPSGRVDWPPPYQDATEKYSSQVRLDRDHRNLLGYVAGQAFPLLDPNDPHVVTKIMWNQYFRPIAAADFDLRFFECQVARQTPGAAHSLMELSELGHPAGYSDLGRPEVDPLPTDPDFKIDDLPPARTRHARARMLVYQHGRGGPEFLHCRIDDRSQPLMERPRCERSGALPTASSASSRSESCRPQKPDRRGDGLLSDCCRSMTAACILLDKVCSGMVANPRS